LIQVSGISNQGARILDYKGTDLHDHGEVTAPDSIDQCDQPHLEAAVAAAEVDLEAEGKFKKDPGKIVYKDTDTGSIATVQSSNILEITKEKLMENTS
jgi:hypothetical protein